MTSAPGGIDQVKDGLSRGLFGMLAVLGMLGAACLAPHTEASPRRAAGPDLLYVDDDAPPGGDGAGWSTAYRHLQDALEHARSLEPPVEIRVAQGTYPPDRSAGAPNGSGDRQSAFWLVDGTTIRGGFAGLTGDDPDERDILAYSSVLTGDLLGNDAEPFVGNEENAYHVVVSWENGPSTALDGLTVTAGHADSTEFDTSRGDLPDDSGAGILMRESSTQLIDCTIRHNLAATPLGELTMKTSGPFAYMEPGGGGMVAYRGSPLLVRSVFEENHSGLMGGGLHAKFSRLRARACRFIDNQAQRGGGLFEEATQIQGEAQIIGCLFALNTAEKWGGGVYAFNTKSVYANCLFIANTADNRGGGLATDLNNVRIVNSAYVANATRTGPGGGIWNWSDLPTYLGVENSILWGNTSPAYHTSAAQIASSDGWIHIGYSCVQEFDPAESRVYSFEHVITDDPLFTRPPEAGDLGDLRLLPGSPCVDAADNTAVPPDRLDLDGDGDVGEALPIDLDARDRFVDDPDTADTGVRGNGHEQVTDMGAFEFQPAACPADFNRDGTVNTLDVLAFLNAWAGGDDAADFNGDGTVNTLDVLAFLNAWAAGC